MKNGGYEEVDHTADLALKIWGEDFYAVLRQAAEGMYGLMSVEYVPNSHEKTGFSIPMSEYENMLVDFLSELLFLSEEKQKYLQKISFEVSDEKLKIHAASHKIVNFRRSIKAVTFHDLKFNRTEKGLETVITFDV